ncbi:MAG: response regulator transcription factor [Candidatus Roseilinea sp.]|uniref:response regulator transcription factor n=1 Tax=Candidatus Roseilinea sp. TaxID=2838777 RepID=UPI0040497E8B
MAARILVADDDPQITRLVRSYLEQAGFQVLTAADGEQALHVIRHDRPDLAVLDVMMPKRDGFELVRLLRADPHLSSLPILMLTARVEDSDKLHGLDLGADDYLTKPFNPSEVVARVRALLRRASGALRPSPIIEIRGLRIDLEQRQVSVAGRAVELTPTEFDLLRVLMQHPNRAFTRGELIDAALGYMYEGFERTIDSHVKNLRKKIEPDPSNPVYIETVFGVGYRLRE